MKPYSEYSAEELAMERLFIRWVRQPDDLPIRKFWLGWIEKYPHMADTVEQANELVHTASDWNPEDVTAQESASLWSRIRSTIEILPEIDQLEPSWKAMAARGNFLRWSIGIVTTVFLVMFWFLWEPTAFTNQSQGAGIAKSDTTHSTARQDSTSQHIFLKIK